VLKAIVILIALVVNTSIQAQPTSAWSLPGAYQAPQSAWNDDYQRPKSQWSRPNAYRAPKSTWSTNGSRQPPRDKRHRVGGAIRGTKTRQRARGRTASYWAVSFGPRCRSNAMFGDETISIS
jgi:hypothetical protein